MEKKQIYAIAAVIIILIAAVGIYYVVSDDTEGSYELSDAAGNAITVPDMPETR